METPQGLNVDVPWQSMCRQRFAAIPTASASEAGTGVAHGAFGDQSIMFSKEPRIPDANKASVNAALNVAITVLTSLVIVIGGAFVYVRFLYEPEANPKIAERYAAVAKERLEEHADVIQQETAALAAEIVPPITRAVQRQVDADYGRYVRALEREGEL